MSLYLCVSLCSHCLCLHRLWASLSVCLSLERCLLLSLFLSPRPHLPREAVPRGPWGRQDVGSIPDSHFLAG